MVESWAEEPMQLQEIRNRLTSIGVSVEAWGFVDAYGGTLEAEIRELCGFYPDSAHSIGAGKSLEDCIPWELRRRGYRSVGLHGYTGEFYLRDMIWPKLGFSDWYFKDDWATEELCLGTFLGVCDSAVIDFAFDQMARQTPTFVHALMLSSHEPMPARLIDQPCPLLADMASIGLVQEQARRVVCYVSARLQSDLATGPVSVYVVGDHPPPLSRGLSDRAMQQVPYLVLSAE
jgi:hypothetical protein